jgi:hypothetical protein
MTASHPRPWHRGSVFGDGPRSPLCRETKAQLKALLHLNRRPGRLTLAAYSIGQQLLCIIGTDGQLDPSHETLAARCAVSVSTVQRAIKQLAAFGFLTWARRLARNGSRVWQTSSQYVLTLPGASFVNAVFLQNHKSTSPPLCVSERSAPLPLATRSEIAVAQEALERRRRVVEATMAIGGASRTDCFVVGQFQKRELMRGR